MMNVLVACEFSGIVRDAFREAGHKAISIDLLPTERSGSHIEGDIRCLSDAYFNGFELMIAHPPCTYLASSGARWWPRLHHEQEEALNFVRWLLNVPIPRIALENPVGRISTAIRKPDQIIQPWQFGHGEIKTTCLWLRGLSPLIPTHIVAGRQQVCWRHGETRNRWRNRSRTYPGIAAAMALQWGVS